MTDATTLARHYGGRRSGGSFVLKTCPVCGYRDASIRDGDAGRLLFNCPGNGCSFEDFIAVLRSEGLAPGRPAADWTSPPRQNARDKEAKATAMGELARKLWRKGRPTTGTPVATYLRNRGIDLPAPPTIRYLPNALHKPTGLRLPCMIAAFARYPSNRVEAIHRTFLTENGKKAPVSQEKMTLGPVKGAAIRLASPGLSLIVAEGIENCLSAMQVTGLPGWAAFSAGNLREMILPALPLAAEVLIAADHDANGVGQDAAGAAASYWTAEGRRVRIALPPIGRDFNDLLRAQLATEC